MINLLPAEIKENILYARRNTRLRKWCVIMMLATIGVIIIVFFGQLYMNKSIKSNETQVAAASEQLKNQKLEDTQKQINDISSSLQLVLQVLSREVLFSSLFQQIGTAIPTGTALSDININKVEGGIDLRFNATDYQTATQIQVNLQDPANKIFDKADILNINCAAANLSDPRYLCQVSIRAQFAKNNPFLFVTQGPKS